MKSLDNISDKLKLGNSVFHKTGYPKESELVFEEVPCPLCGSKEQRIIWKEMAERTWFRSGIKKETNVVKCSHCGFIFTNPRPTMETKMLFYAPETNPDLISRKAECAFDLRQQLRFLALYYEILKNLGDFKKKGKLLEVGVAGGLFLLAASDAINCPNEPLDFELEGVAVNEKEAEQARRITRLNIYCTKLENWRTTNKYDVIVAISVLEHIPNLREFTGKIYELLADDGIFAFVVPNNCFLEKKAKLNRKKALNPSHGALMACEHINHFTAETIERLLIGQKFRKLDFRPILVSPPRYWEKYRFRERLFIYAGYFLSRITKRSPLIGSLFGIASK